MSLFMNLQFMTLWTCSYQHFLGGVCISSASFPWFHIYEVIIWHFCKYILQGDYYTYRQQEVIWNLVSPEFKSGQVTGYDNCNSCKCLHHLSCTRNVHERKFGTKL